MDVMFDVAHGIQMVSMLYKDDDVSISKKKLMHMSQKMEQRSSHFACRALI
jgi:hypothetical protein